MLFAPSAGARRRAMEPFRGKDLEIRMSRKHRLHDELDRLQERLPNWARRMLRSARKPSAGWVRIPIAVALIIGGIVGIVLPIIGFWMVPLGLALLAIDLPFLRGPLARILAFINRKLATTG
jgi:hypothetical protein